jgi:putative ABC transport system substrate-binding protein
METQTVARTIGKRLLVVEASTEGELEAAFATLVQQRAAVLIVQPTALFDNRRAQIAALAVRHHIPSIYETREAVEAGGLMAYGPNFMDQLRQLGVYAGRILKGEKPADLPVLQPTKFEMMINLKTAKTLGIDVPPSLLALADNVIE